MTVHLQAAEVQLHSELPPTRVWAYDGHFPGPTIEVRSGERIRVAWTNALTGTMPVVASVVQNLPVPAGQLPISGRPGHETTPLADVAAIRPWNVVHLHGAKTNAWNDGWTENATLSGGTLISEYPNDQPSTTQWYHDHAMDITAFNVMSGLAGMYLIRDDEEQALSLPSGSHEVPLIICDRNLDTDTGNPAGNLTGQLLHKLAYNLVPVTNEQVDIPFTGPFNLVNGKIWPHLSVKPRWYRFRILNACNSRIYLFDLRDSGGNQLANVMQLIGTDAGLLGAPVALTQISLAPAERVDVLIDFSAFKGQSITLVDATNAAAPANVMQFRIEANAVQDPFKLPSSLSPTFSQLTPGNLPPHKHRWIVLSPPNPNNKSKDPAPPVVGMPEIWEMHKLTDAESATVVLPIPGFVQLKESSGKVITLKRIARDFMDMTQFFVKADGWELWNFINLAAVPGPTHPMHIHLTRFQILSRDTCDVSKFDIDEGGTQPGAPIPITGTSPAGAGERGWKDVVQVPAGQMVRVAGQFAGGTGRFMYHCHILEHEDEGMMRSFDVLPAEVIALDPTLTEDH